MFVNLLYGLLAAVIGGTKLEFHNLIPISMNLPVAKSLCYMYEALW